MVGVIFILSLVTNYLDKYGIGFSQSIVSLLLLGIVGSETLLFFGDVWFTLWGHFITLLLATFAQLYIDEDGPLLQVIALVPVFRLVNLGMPVFFQLTIYWFPLIYGPLLPAVYLIGRENDSVSLDLRWKWTAFALPVAIPLSAFLGTVEYLIITPPALIPSWNLANLAMLAVVMIGFVGLVEELLFRGVLQQTFTERFGRTPGILLASAIFGLMHSGYHIPGELLFAGSLGLLFGLVYEVTGSVGLVSIMHGVLNVFLFGIVPYRGRIPTLGPLIEAALRLLGA